MVEFSTSDRFKIKSNLLNLLLEGGKYNEKIYISGYTTNGCMGFARFALERLTRYAFNIQRFPGYEDRNIIRAGGNDSFKYFSECIDFFENVVSEEEIKIAIEEIINVYHHTQKQLKGKQTITCFRGLQPFEYLQFIKELESDSNPKQDLSYKANTIVSFRDNEQGYSHRLTIKVKIPVEKVLMHHAFIETDNRDSLFAKKNDLVHENELLYINTDSKGMFTFSKEEILNLEEMGANIHFHRINKESEDLAIENNHEVIRTSAYNDLIMYDQTYWIYLKEYKKHVLDMLPWWIRKRAKKELELL
ncbi:hypothetical protein [Virgibacillus halodenitrificans]|uniref:hypothetical protein n=1 Tax=Virgibacillus halodenitrificans TaxID=1482 RepID=UPI00045CDE9D|nr:hypothetical protein [Virgibacillus halodenitrificans]CDQ37689.1 hypothetical protein BN993_07251 [Virgibacillus halodenitrificans]